MIYFNPQTQGFLDSEIHPIPEHAIAITAEQHLSLLNALNSGRIILEDLSLAPEPPSPFHIWDGKEWQENREQKQAHFQAALNKKLAELNATAQKIVEKAAKMDETPSFEIQSWTLQATEAKAWAANPHAPTPILDQIAAARGVPVEMLKAAALRKTLAFELLTAHIAGQRQALETQIQQASDFDELDKIEIVFKLPENG